MLLRDMQQFKKIVIETRNSHSILDQLVRGELPLHEETVEMTQQGISRAVQSPAQTLSCGRASSVER